MKEDKSVAEIATIVEELAIDSEGDVTTPLA